MEYCDNAVVVLERKFEVASIPIFRKKIQASESSPKDSSYPLTDTFNISKSFLAASGDV